MTTSSHESYRLEYRQGRPLIVSSRGDVLPPSCYCDCITWKFDEWVARNRDFVESGVHLYFLSPGVNWDTMASLYCGVAEHGGRLFCLM